MLEKKKIKGSKEKTEAEDPSPRCVLEILATSSDSENSSSSSSPDKSLSSPLSTVTATATNNGRQWNKMIESIKKKSMRRFSVIPLLASYELTRKNMRRKQPKLSSSPSPDNVFDCGQFLVAKPSWRNFTYDELVAATDGFNTGIDAFRHLSFRFGSVKVFFYFSIEPKHNRIRNGLNFVWL